ncbi:hypothetical protein ACFX2F_011226 [Malus domestica]
MGAICCLEKAGLPLQQGSSQNDGLMGQTFSKVLKREEVGQIKILEVQEWSFYWWRFKCALELNVSPYKNLHSTKLQKSKRRLLRNRRGVCFLKSWAAQRPRGSISEIEEAPAQKSKRRLLSQKLGCSETTRVDLRNRRGVCFLKSWAAQRPRRPISEIEEACFLKSWAAQRPRGPISEIEEAPTFPALSAPVTRTLNFAEIMGILSKISGEVEST